LSQVAVGAIESHLLRQMQAHPASGWFVKLPKRAG